MKTTRLSHILSIALAVAAFTFSQAVLAQAQTESVLYSFSGGSDGGGPPAGLVADRAGNFYGVTASGGQTSGNCANNQGCGVVFELSPDGSGGWTETVLYTFTGGTDGAFPASTLLIDDSGNLYGAAASGGNVTSKDCSPYGCGVVFELSRTTGGWTESVLYSFHFTDGERPTSLIRDASGNFYGTTLLGGNSNSGTVFKLSSGSTSWVETILHSFTGGAGGYQPNGVVLDASGNVYGTTAYGGVGDVPACGFAACGIVFKLTPTSGGGWYEVALYTFTGGTDGGVPNGLIMDPAGRLYGTTFSGGKPPCGGQSGCGVVFRLIPGVGGWHESVLYTFTGTNGKNPAANLVQATSGNLYGTTTEGGIKNSNCDVSGCGLVFKLAPTSGGWWTPSTLHEFDSTDGAFPQATPLLDSAGNLYGTTLYGGASNFGTVFEIQP
jgi:uncharacterized repeat protein (TIGR03803 family)